MEDSPPPPPWKTVYIRQSVNHLADDVKFQPRPTSSSARFLSCSLSLNPIHFISSTWTLFPFFFFPCILGIYIHNIAPVKSGVWPWLEHSAVISAAANRSIPQEVSNPGARKFKKYITEAQVGVLKNVDGQQPPFKKFKSRVTFTAYVQQQFLGHKGECI